MAETILLVLWMGTALFFTCRNIKLNNERKNHKSWLADCKDCLHGIECEFRHKCQELTDNYLAEYSKGVYKCHHYHDDIRKFHADMLFNASKEYMAAIEELKKEYINTMFDKAVNRMRDYRFNSIPEHLSREYDRNIAEIADSFLELCSSTRTNINNISNNNFE